ncbi:MAG TPA: peptidoglycan-binding domain-containing protein [Candidatus Eisenbacteria bacterium]|nr:peptidoglycan-binding domain-containing protein [Candidatus Eisenbacteria bacterium]
MIERLIGWLRRDITRPVVFFPLVAVVAVLTVYGVIELGLATTGRWERDLVRRAQYERDRQPNALVSRYEQRLRAVRAALQERGYAAGPTDAAMNSHTAEALRSFQRRHGLHVTGRPDPATAMALGLER